MRSIKVKFTFFFSVIIIIVVMVLANLIYIFSIANQPTKITPKELVAISKKYPEAQELLQERPDIEDLAKIGSMISQHQREEYSDMLVKITAPLILVSTIVAYILATYLVKPIENLAHQISTIHKWDISQRIPEEKSSEEIEYLIHSFNNLLGNLEDSFQAQENFIQDAAHELRTPLAAMQANIQVLNEKKDPSLKDYEQLVDTIEVLNTKLVKLNESLLFLDRKDADTNEYKSTEITELINDIIESITPIAREKSVQFKTQYKKGIYASIHLEKFTTAIKNILENSIKYSKDKNGTITIRIQDKRNQILIVIRDQGVGISKTDLPKIFDRFFRGENAYKSPESGSGLGLSIVKKIIDEHQGTIDISSRLNKGTTVKITLPKEQS